jgi:ABC-type transport system involved in multi-copper enzyme maturation permease subunit
MPGLIAGEFRKLFTTWLWLLLAAMAITALYAILDIAFADAPDTFTLPLSTPQGQRTLLAAGVGAAPLAAVLGAIGLTGEFRHRTATATFLATPHRGRVVVAKLIAYALAGGGYGLAGIAVTIAIALPWLASKDIDLVAGGSAIAATLAGVTAAVAVFAMLGVGLGALLREQVATVAGLLLYLFVVERVLTSIATMDRWTSYLPGQAQEALVGSTLTNQRLLEPWQGGLVLAGYGLVLALAGTRLAIRRDVP